MNERWPPIYDEEDLKRAIRELCSPDPAGTSLLHKGFFASGRAWSDFCQGDVIQFTSGCPVIDDEGETAEVGEYDHWMIIGNTCDMDRSIDEVPWSQIVPLDDMGRDEDVPADVLAAYARYQHNREFYVPHWRRVSGGQHWAAQFLIPITIHRTALQKTTKVVARLSRKGWLLFHSCLVRFLARDDGRETP